MLYYFHNASSSLPLNCFSLFLKGGGGRKGYVLQKSKGSFILFETEHEFCHFIQIIEIC